jgi:hypothetical protein
MASPAVDAEAARAARRAGSSLADAKGLVGVFKRLAEQHGEVLALLSSAEETEDPVRRRELWSKIRVELASHERAEECQVYPCLVERDALRDVTERHTAEARRLQTTIDMIAVTDCSSQTWAALLLELTALVRQHVKEEEDEFFPRAQEAIGLEVTELLEARFLATKIAMMRDLSAS